MSVWVQLGIAIAAAIIGGRVTAAIKHPEDALGAVRLIAEHRGGGGRGKY